ncbi:hypothetical protein [Streptomyces sp. NPDC059168]|uniref:hypothetical protein n=1 Tax=Streptomyces sp. NPDC059168 TaxID=3346753 RepID=UPI0036BFD617
MAAERSLSRFSGWSELQPLCTSGVLEDRRPFFSGTNVQSRMSEVRRAINHIRIHWDRYPEFMAELRAHMERVSPDSPGADDPGLDGQLADLFASTKDWADRRVDGGPQPEDYSAVRLYTSDAGYQRIFSTINTAFRTVSLTGDPVALRSAAFLVELLSIDLFNYRHTHRTADNFQGTVYRGMAVTAEELAAFARAAAGPVEQRYLSVPLAMMSASRSRAKATAFARETARRLPDRRPLLWSIDVAGLPPELLNVYRSAFPESTVTSMCAVPVHGLSEYAYEKEVLLRGPFFQILGMREDDAGGPGRGPMHTIEAVMLNSNRDHVTTIASDEGEDRRARDLFRAIVTLHRAGLCLDYARTRGFDADADFYRAQLDRNRAEFDRLAAAA